MNGYKLLVKLEETAKMLENLREQVQDLNARIIVLETRKVGRPPRKAEECGIATKNSSQ